MHFILAHLWRNQAIGTPAAIADPMSAYHMQRWPTRAKNTYSEVCKSALDIAANGSPIGESCAANALPEYPFERVDGSLSNHQSWQIRMREAVGAVCDC